MRVPGEVSETVNVYLAFRAALIVVLARNRSSEHPIRTVLVPGMGTGIGQVPPGRAARQMRSAYDTVLTHRGSNMFDARRILRQHRDLLA
jgi:O-acetyl-ADP-ribose deacetylase (regulator of RNase III)